MALTILCTAMAKRLLTIDDKSLIRALRLEKGWGSLRMIREFPQRQWKRSTLNDLIKKIVLHQGLLPDIIAHSGHNFTFQQDGAPAHRSRKTVAFLTAHVPDFIEPENWPPNSPDLNPVDYSIWGMLQQLVYRQRIRDIEHLKEVLTACWDEISEDTINRTIGQFRKRLSLVIAANGGHIEHHFD